MLVKGRKICFHEVVNKVLVSAFITLVFQFELLHLGSIRKIEREMYAPQISVQPICQLLKLKRVFIKSILDRCVLFSLIIFAFIVKLGNLSITGIIVRIFLSEGHVGVHIVTCDLLLNTDLVF